MIFIKKIFFLTQIVKLCQYLCAQIGVKGVTPILVTT